MKQNGILVERKSITQHLMNFTLMAGSGKTVCVYTKKKKWGWTVIVLGAYSSLPLWSKEVAGFAT
jgi:predicted membrane channel-forming protein YqfA (hemolysin III family)